MALTGPYQSCIDLDSGAEVVLSIFEITPPTLPECGSVRATGAAVRVSGLGGGDWLLLGIPGEPTAPYAHYLRSRSPAGPERTLLIGYTDEYTGYMLTAEDWLTGGYECSTNIWGPREGEQVLSGLLEAASIAWTPEIEDPEAGTTRFVDFDMPHEAAVEASVTSDHGTPLGDAAHLWWPDTSAEITLPAPTTVERAVGLARFAWKGGDPAVDYPEVVVERSVDGTSWELVTDAAGRPASSFRGTVIVTYAPDPIDSATPTGHHYTATWQPAGVAPLGDTPLAPFALPLGSYRLRVTGQARSASGIEGYEVASPTFTIVEAALHPDSSLELEATGLAITALLGPAPGLRALRHGVSDGAIPLVGPWTVDIELDDESHVTETVVPSEEGAGSVPLDASTLSRVVSVDVRDPAGNGGVLGAGG